MFDFNPIHKHPKKPFVICEQRSKILNAKGSPQ